MRRWVTLGRFVVTQSSGPAALRQALPLYLALAIAAAIIFAPQGLDASTVVRMGERSLPARLLLLALWVTATLPAARACVLAEQNTALRGLPVPRGWFLLFIGAVLALLEIPWLALWLRGGGLIEGLGAALIALALHASLVARVKTPAEAVLLAMPCAAWLLPASLVMGSQSMLSMARIAIGAPAFVGALSRAFRRAPERATARARGRFGGSPARALATAYGLVLLRAHAGSLQRGLWLLTIGSAWAGLAVTNDDALKNDGIAATRFILTVMIPCTIFAAATVTGPLLRMERAAEWVLASSGVRAAQQRRAVRGLLGAGLGALGLAAGAVLGVVLALDGAIRPFLAIVLMLAGTTFAVLTEMAVRWSVREGGGDSGRVVGSLLLLMALGEGALWLFR